MDTISKAPTIRHSEEIKDLAAALAAAQGDYGEVKKERTGRVKGKTKDGKFYDYSYKYADLADVLKVAHPVNSKHNLALVHIPMMEAGNIILYTRLIHGETGQWIECEYPVCRFGESSHQSMGGSMTYAKRQTTTALTAIAAEADLDAQEGTEGPPADPKGKKTEARSATKRPAPEVVQGQETTKPLPPEIGAQPKPFTEDESLTRMELMIEDLKEAQTDAEFATWADRWTTYRKRMMAEHVVIVEEARAGRGSDAE